MSTISQRVSLLLHISLLYGPLVHATYTTSKNFPGPAMSRLGPDYDKTTSRREYDYNLVMTITMTIITMVVTIYLLIRN